MKKLKIGMPILGLDSKSRGQIIDEAGKRDETLRDVLIAIMGSPQFLVQSNENAIILRKVGMEIYLCEEEVLELEDNELTVLKSALANPRVSIDMLSAAAFEDACKEADA